MGISFSLVILAVAISLDNFAAGMAYGLRKIKIPVKSIVIIGLCTAISLGVAMLCGQLLQGFLTPAAANRVGGLILVLIGIWVIIQFFRREKEQEEPAEKLELTWEIKSLGVVIHILKRPSRADLDSSGNINAVEALMLGTALSLDAFGVGIGAAMLGYSPLILAGAAGVAGVIFLFAGLTSGRFFSHMQLLQRFTFFPGIILILVGFMKM